MTAAGFEVILQEYIPGPPTEHYFIDGFMDREHVVQARFARQRLRMYPPDFGNSTYMVSVDIGKVRPAMDALRDLAREPRLPRDLQRGVQARSAGRELLPDRGERPAVVVRGLRRGLRSARVRDGVCGCARIAAAATAILTLSARPASTRTSTGRNISGIAATILACRQHRCSRRIGVWLTAIKPTFAWDDPNPAVVGMAAIFRQWLRTRRAAARS